MGVLHGSTTVELWECIQKINVSMDTMDTMGHYRLYVALLQSFINSPGFADE